MLKWLLSFMILLAAFAMTACKLPLNESDVSEVEWEVTMVTLSSNATPQVLRVYIEGDEQGGEYYKDFDLKNMLAADDLVRVADVAFMSESSSFSLGGFQVNTQQNVTIPEGTKAYFSTDWFYKAETDALFNTTVVAKIRIITSTADIILP